MIYLTFQVSQHVADRDDTVSKTPFNLFHVFDTGGRNGFFDEQRGFREVLDELQLVVAALSS